MIHPWSIARRLFVANLLIVVVFIAIVGSATFVDARDRTYDEAGQRMAGIAAAIAASPLVLDAASSPDPTGTLQPYARDVTAEADVDFVTIMAPDRTRWTHPRDEEFGRPYIGSIDAALRGDVFTKDAIAEWLDYKRTKELNPIRMRPTPHEFYLYFDI